MLFILMGEQKRKYYFLTSTVPIQTPVFRFSFKDNTKIFNSYYTVCTVNAFLLF